MEDENAQVLAGVCLLTEDIILEEFKDKPKLEKRTSKGIAESTGLDKELIDFILLESFYFESCEGCKGDMWKLR